MSIRVVVGANWGDEGKGRLVDYLSAEADIVVRYQGGSNAGHTIVSDKGTFKLHLIPSGILREHIVNVLGTGALVNLEACVKEIQDLKTQGISITPENYKISHRAPICFPFHTLLDHLEEERLGHKKFGSTRQGIAPGYGDFVMKNAIPMGALFSPTYLRSELERILSLKNEILTKIYQHPPISVDAMMEWCLTYGEILKPHIIDTTEFFEQQIAQKKRILFEAQLGSLRDLYYGIFPYTTSSCTLAGFAPIGAGCFGHLQPEVIAVVKAFATCVGEGPFVTEMPAAEASELREIALEYGAATGRPRRIGHFDAVATKYGAKVQGASSIALTKLDSLSGRKTLKICTHYKINNVLTQQFPLTFELYQAEPVYEELPGWEEDIRHVRSFEKLPLNAQAYVKRIESLINCPIRWISVGPHRDEMILR